MLPFLRLKDRTGSCGTLNGYACTPVGSRMCPTVPGGTPNALMVPREVAKADGLRITE